MDGDKMLELVRGNEFLAGILVSWFAWVTASIFTQRQELAVLKEILKAVTNPNETRK